MQKFFTMRVARQWNGEVVDALFLEIILRPGWMGLCATLSSRRYPCQWQWYWNQIIFKVFFNSNHPVILIYSEQKMAYILNFPLFFTVHIVTTFKCFIITQMHTQLVLLQCYKKRLSTFLRELRELYMPGTLTCLKQKTSTQQDWMDHVLLAQLTGCLTENILHLQGIEGPIESCNFLLWGNSGEVAAPTYFLTFEVSLLYDIPCISP